MLDGFYALLVGEWCASDGIYKHWQNFFQKLGQLLARFLLGKMLSMTLFLVSGFLRLSNTAKRIPRSLLLDGLRLPSISTSLVAGFEIHLPMSSVAMIYRELHTGSHAF